MEENREPLLPLKIRLKHKRQTHEKSPKSKKRSRRYLTSSNDSSSSSSSSGDEALRKYQKRKWKHVKEYKFQKKVERKRRCRSSSSDSGDDRRQCKMSDSSDTEDYLPLSKLSSKEKRKRQKKSRRDDSKCNSSAQTSGAFETAGSGKGKADFFKSGKVTMSHFVSPQTSRENDRERPGCSYEVFPSSSEGSSRSESQGWERKGFFNCKSSNSFSFDFKDESAVEIFDDSGSSHYQENNMDCPSVLSKVVKPSAVNKEVGDVKSSLSAGPSNGRGDLRSVIIKKEDKWYYSSCSFSSD